MLLGACETRFGAYLRIDGDGRGIRFEQVELYFGVPIDATDFGTPAGTFSGKVFAREFEDTDIYDVPRNADGSKATETTYWLPGGGPTKLGSYVAAVAFRDGMPVGIGERFDFRIDPAAVAVYDLELEPYVAATTDRWGSDPTCLAWRRPRDGAASVVAVVRGDDRDCDLLASNADCNDACPSGSTGCDAERVVCGDPAGCALGCSDDMFCIREVCISPTACGFCAPMLTLDEKLGCAIDREIDHIEIEVKTDQGGAPCASEAVFTPYGLPCKNPAIEWIDPRGTGNYTLSVSEAGGDMCLLSFHSTTNEPLERLSGIHTIVSFDDRSIGRTSVIVGLRAALPTGTACPTMPPQYTVTGLGAPYRCP
jgi:hypothetical protein